jgi:hypothetical protein
LEVVAVVRSDSHEQAQRRTAADILRRSPMEFSRRTSFGEELRMESVLVQWPDGKRASLDQSRDDRISFALRDRYEAPQSSCRSQLAALTRQHGIPDAVSVAWSYQASWEGEPPLDQTGSYRFTWAAMAELLDLPATARKP